MLNPSTTWCADIEDNLQLALSSNDVWEEARSIGDILSPLFYNLYLTPLDDFIDKLKKKYEKVPFEPALPLVPGGGQGQRGGRSHPRPLGTVMDRDHIVCGYSKIFYVRFVDAWVIGVKGSYLLANQIKEEINQFIEEEFKLYLKQGVGLIASQPRKKSNIVKLERDLALRPPSPKVWRVLGPAGAVCKRVKFLGHYIQVATNSRKQSSRVEQGQTNNNTEPFGHPHQRCVGALGLQESYAQSLDPCTGVGTKGQKWVFFPFYYLCPVSGRGKG